MTKPDSTDAGGVIEWTLPGALSRRLIVEHWDGLGPHEQRDATEADLHLAGFVRADQQEAALATLTRERDEARRARDSYKLSAKAEQADAAPLRDVMVAARKLLAEAVGPADPPQRGSNLETLYLALRAFDKHCAEPATPPAPPPVVAKSATTDESLPGGQGPVTVAMLGELIRNARSDTFENFYCDMYEGLQGLEQGGEGREG